MPVSFTINFICHDNFELLERIIPENIENLCGRTKESFDIILTVDGAERVEPTQFLDAAPRWGIDELRFRRRARNCARGDPSNNGHLHSISDKTPYSLSLEGDVAFFLLDRGFDVLAEFRSLFERHQSLALATRMDDHECWVWKLEDTGPPFEPGVRSVNRVASHFLVYDTMRFRQFLSRRTTLRPEIFHDSPENWFNYEDFLSANFAHPAGPGIAFVEMFPVRVYHCDVKVEPGSIYYTKNLAVKLSEFERRRAEIENEVG